MKMTSFRGPALSLKKEKLDLFVCDLSDPISKVNAELPIEINILEQSTDLENTSIFMITSYLRTKQKIFVAYHRSAPVGYLFTSTARCRVGEIQDHLVIVSQEVYLFNAYTYKAFRGKHIYPTLITHAAQYYKDLCFRKALIFATRSNTSSINGIKKAGFKCYENITFSNILGWKSWNHIRGNSDTQSYFSHEV